MNFSRVFFWMALGVVGGMGSLLAPHGARAQLFPLNMVLQETLVLAPRGDLADVYFPVPPVALRDFFTDAFPIVTVLQGALVDKSHYEEFGKRLASFGFVVVVPNHLQVLGPPGTPAVPFPDPFVILDVLAQMEGEDADPASPLYGIVDTSRMGLSGHSLGGAVGLFAIGRLCQPPFCFGLPAFPLPAAVQAGAFYGTTTVDPTTGGLIDVNTAGVPVALLRGTLDSRATAPDVAATLAILDGPRELIPIEGANHFGITDVNNPPGAVPDPVPPTTPQLAAVQQVAQAVGRFLLARLHGGVVFTTTLTASHSGKCLDVPGSATSNGAVMQQWRCHGGVEQQWRFVPLASGAYQLVNYFNGKCLDVMSDSQSSGAPIIQWPCDGGNSQQWRVQVAVNDTLQLVNVLSNKCLEVQGASTSNGVSVVQATCDGDAQQRWRPFVDVPPLTYVAVHSGKCLDVPGNSSNNGTQLQQLSCHGGNDQRWQLRPVAGGAYQVVSMLNGKCLDVAQESLANNAPIIQWTCHGGANQQWELLPLPNSAHQLVSILSDKCMEVLGGSFVNGAKIVQRTCDGVFQQRWYVP